MHDGHNVWACRQRKVRFDARNLGSKALWEAMDGIGEAAVSAAQRSIVARLRELFPKDFENLYIDHVNHSIWVDDNNDHRTVCLCDQGEQKQDSLRQLSLTMLTPTTLPVPIVWELYEGDGSEFPGFPQKVAREMGCKDLAVTDRTEWATDGVPSSQESTRDPLRTTWDTHHFSIRADGHWTDDLIRMHVFMCLYAHMLSEVLRRLLADSTGIDLTKHALLDRLGRIHDGWVIVNGKPLRTLEDLTTQERTLWDAVLSLPGETLGAY